MAHDARLWEARSRISEDLLRFVGTYSALVSDRIALFKCGGSRLACRASRRRTNASAGEVRGVGKRPGARRIRRMVQGCERLLPLIAEDSPQRSRPFRARGDARPRTTVSNLCRTRSENLFGRNQRRPATSHPAGLTRVPL